LAAALLVELLMQLLHLEVTLYFQVLLLPVAVAVVTTIMEM
jgi:hypothetical protein